MRRHPASHYTGLTPAAQGDWRTVRTLLPYLWDFRGRVALALTCLFVAKLANVGIPLVLKEIVDSLDSTKAVLVLPAFLLIAYGRPDATDEEVIRAAKSAHIYDFVQSLPKKFESIVGERGLKLSGGEKQRVAIARTLLKNPAILVFDEATSALDSHTEKIIQAELRQIAENRTTLVIAHRLSTVVDADQILVMEGGRIVEWGSHRDLLERGEVYAHMWAIQQLEEKAKEGAIGESTGRLAAV